LSERHAGLTGSRKNAHVVFVVTIIVFFSLSLAVDAFDRRIVPLHVTASSAYIPTRVLRLAGGGENFYGRLRGGQVNPATASFVREHDLSTTERLEDVYKIEDILGEGGFATVRSAKHKITGRKVAVKTIDLFKIQTGKLDMLRNEIEVMKMLDHPNIVRLYETYSEKEKLHLVMEHCEGGDLFDFLMKTSIEEGGSKTWSDGQGAEYQLTERGISELVAKMLSAVNYLHQRGIAHRDIKPENFLLESKASHEGFGEIKIIDFGFSKVFHGTNDLHNMLGSPYYVAPEVLSASDTKGYGPQCDIWSLGVVVYTMLCGQPPFYGDDNNQIYKDIQTGEYTWPDDIVVSQDAKDFVSQMLVLDPEKRISAAGALHHPWITSASKLEVNPITSRMLSQLSKVREVGKLKKQALLAIGYSLDRESIRQMRETFRSLDKEGKGLISFDDLHNAMIQFGMKREQVEELFMSISEGNRDGMIEYTTFVAACLEKQTYLDQSQVYHAFHKFKDKSGSITAESLREILGRRFSLQEVEQMVQEADLTGDGKISWGEFTLMMGNRLPVSRVAWRVLPLFEGLSADEVSRIMEISTIQNFSPGVDIIVEGTEASSFFLVEEGELEVSRRRHKDIRQPKAGTSSMANSPPRKGSQPELPRVADEDAAHQQKDIIVVLEAKTVVGEMELVNPDKTRFATVTALTPLKTREIPYADFKALMERDYALGYKVMTNIARVAARSVYEMNKKYSDCGAALDLYANSFQRRCDSNANIPRCRLRKAPQAQPAEEDVQR